MNDIDVCSEVLQEFIDSVVSAACKVFKEFCKLIKELLRYLSENLCKSEWWIYTQSWLDACIKNSKSLHYMRRCKERSIRTISSEKLLKFTRSGENKITSMYALAGYKPRVHQLKAECEFYTPLSMHLKNFEVRKKRQGFSSKRHPCSQRMERSYRRLYRSLPLRSDFLHPRRSPILQRRLRNSWS